MPSRPRTPSPRPPCPRCAGRLRRAKRQWLDRLNGLAGAPVRRWQCTAIGCGWKGVLRVVRPDADETEAAATEQAPLLTRPVVTALLAGAAIGIAAAASWHWVSSRPASIGAGRVFPPGESYDGDLLPANHPWVRLVYRPSADPSQPAASAPAVPVTGAVVPLALRRNCAWGDPGRNPYRGTVEEALHTARLPAEVVTQIAEAVKAGKPADRLTIGNSGIRADRGGQVFDQRSIAMTYGRTLCLGTQVNFKIGHVERGSLYAATDRQGKLHSVMVPDVCGNVSVLGSEAERNELDGLEGADGLGGGGGSSRPNAPGRAASGAAANAVSAPGTLACVLAGCVAAAVWRRPKRRD